MPVHLTFDLAAVVAAVALTAAVWTWRMRGTALVAAGEAYLATLSAGIVIGSYGLGTANLWASGMPGVGRSILGALAGGIVAVEGFKALRRIGGSTGLIFVPTFCALVIVGRIGCALSGLEDNTFGIPTDLPWGQDHGDAVLRHPVAVYESLIMAAFLALFLWVLARRSPLALRRGFHLMVAFYAIQRFGLEFLKPYATLLGPFSLFQMTCRALMAYAAVMLKRPLT